MSSSSIAPVNFSNNENEIENEDITNNNNFNAKDGEFFVDTVIERVPKSLSLTDQYVRKYLPSFLQPIYGRFSLPPSFEEEFAKEEAEYSKRIEIGIEKLPSFMRYAVKVRGLLSLSNLYDAFWFKWCKYLDDDSALLKHEFNIRNQKEVELTNVGLLSALLFTVAFEQVAREARGQTDEPLLLHDVASYIHLLSWSLSAISLLIATIWSVIMAITINETYNDLELKRFLRVYDHISNGWGPLFHSK